MPENQLKDFVGNPDVQEKLLTIWQDILHNPDIEIRANFVDLGGDSLSAMLCISRARAIFGVELFLEDFFMDSATVEGIAAIITQEQLSKKNGGPQTD